MPNKFHVNMLVCKRNIFYSPDVYVHMCASILCELIMDLNEAQTALSSIHLYCFISALSSPFSKLNNIMLSVF